MARKTKSTKRAARAGADTQTQMLTMVHQVWLAGLGAVARAQQGAPKLLQELVAEGAQVQADTRGAAEKALRCAMCDMQQAISERVGKVRGEAADAFENLEKIFKSRVHTAMTQLGVPSAGEVESLSRRVDALNANIDKLARKRKAAPRVRKDGSAHVATH